MIPTFPVTSALDALRSALVLLAAVLLAVPVLLGWLAETRRERAQRLAACGMTRTAIAARLGVSRRTVGRLLAG